MKSDGTIVAVAFIAITFFRDLLGRGLLFIFIIREMFVSLEANVIAVTKSTGLVHILFVDKSWRVQMDSLRLDLRKYLP